MTSFVDMLKNKHVETHDDNVFRFGLKDGTYYFRLEKIEECLTLRHLDDDEKEDKVLSVKIQSVLGSEFLKRVPFFVGDIFNIRFSIDKSCRRLYTVDIVERAFSKEAMEVISKSYEAFSYHSSLIDDQLECILYYPREPTTLSHATVVYRQEMSKNRYAALLALRGVTEEDQYYS